MHLLFSCFLIIVLLPLARTYKCPEPEVCQCENIFLSCNCDQRQNIALRDVFHNDISHVQVNGCGRVILSMGVFINLPLKHLDLLDIVELHVRPFALTGIPSLVSLRMANISKLDIQKNGFSTISNVTSIELHNVTADGLKKGTFEGLSNIGSFVVSDSVVGTVEPFAIVLTNVSSFEISNTKFGEFENMSLMINGGEKVMFDECSFNRTGNRSFNLSYLQNLSFNNCEFGTISTETIQTKHLEKFTFTNSSVEEVESDAFKYMDITTSVIFTDNIIKKANVNFLFPSFESNSGSHRDNLTINLEKNELNCDCDLSWLWTQNSGIYNILVNTSTCIGSPNTYLSSAVIVVNEEFECLEIVIKSASVNPTDASTASTNLTFSPDGNVGSLVGTTESSSEISNLSLALLLSCYLISFRVVFPLSGDFFCT